VGGIGLEPVTGISFQVQQNKGVSDTSADTLQPTRVQNPVHVDTSSGNISSELAEIVEVWPELPEHIRQTIKTLVSSVTATSEEMRS